MRQLRVAAARHERRPRLFSGLACLAVLSLVAAAGCDSSTVEPVHPSSPDVHPHELLGPVVSGDDDYTFDLMSGVTTLRVAAQDLDGHLYRIESTPGVASYPLVTTSGHAVQVATSGGGDAHLVVYLDEDVAWTLRLSAGTSTASIDMSHGTLSGLAALAGISTLDLTLGRPQGDIVLAEEGGLSTFAIHVPAGTDMSIEIGGGAGSVSLFGDVHNGVSAGARFSTDDGAASDRYTVRAQGGVSSISVDSG